MHVRLTFRHWHWLRCCSNVGLIRMKRSPPASFPTTTWPTLCAIHQRLLQAAQDMRLHPSLRQAALRHSSKTYAELLVFISEHGEYPRTHRLLGSSKPVRSALHHGTAAGSGHFYGVH